MNVLSPCINICRIDRDTGYCEGCRRSMAEIAEWLYYSDERKRAIMAQLPVRPGKPRKKRERPRFD